MQEEKGITKPNKLGSAFAFRFLKALSRIKKKKGPRSSASSIRRRARSIKLAADASMALAVGRRRAWSRCILRRALKARATHARLRSHVTQERKMKKKKKVVRLSTCAGIDRLRRIVPGGEAMDLCSLMDETCHYMNCLAVQVQVMQHIVDSLSI